MYSYFIIKVAQVLFIGKPGWTQCWDAWNTPRCTHPGFWLAFLLSVLISPFHRIMFIIAQTLNHIFFFPMSSPLFFFFFLRTFSSPSLSALYRQTFLLCSSGFLASRLHVSIPAFPFMLLWGRFCFLSWLSPSIYWNKSSGISLKMSPWNLNVWLLWSLKKEISLHLMPDR